MVCRKRRYRMEDLRVEQVEAVHRRIIEERKGDSRIISEANLHQMVFSANLIREFVPRGAFIFYSLCAYPAFRQGNFRTALALTERVLKAEGYRITGDMAGIIALAEGIRGFTTEPEEIEQWLCNNIEKSVQQ
jgi:prophage maintenance system killer protein